MNIFLSIVIESFASLVNVAAIRWPELANPSLTESEFDRKAGRIRKVVATIFFVALVVIPLAVMGWLLS